MIRLTEIESMQGSIAKKYIIDKEGKVGIKAAARIHTAVARPIEVDFENLSSYFDSLAGQDNKCITLGVCGETGEEKQLTTRDNLKENYIARTKDYFEFANSGSIHLLLLDYDSKFSEAQREELLKELDTLLAPAIIGRTATERSKICRWYRPSTSASVKINGKTGNGLHVFIPVKSLKSELVELIHRFSWLKVRGYKITKAATIISESLIDPMVGSAERIVFSSDALVSSERGEEFYEKIQRKCAYSPGGILDNEVACNILRTATEDFHREWSQFKIAKQNDPQVQELRKQWKEKQAAKMIDEGVEPNLARKAVEGFVSEKLFSTEILLRSGGKDPVSVQDILRNIDDWIGKGYFCDPIVKDTGRNVGMVLGSKYSPFLNVKSHGGIRYRLKWDQNDLEDWITTAELDELEEDLARHLLNSDINSIREEALKKKASGRLGCTLGPITAEVKKLSTKVQEAEEKEEVELSPEIMAPVDKKATHSDIIDDFIRRIGDCKGYGDGLYVWKEGASIWEKYSAGSIRNKIRTEYNHVNSCKKTYDYNALALEILKNPAITVDSWNEVKGIPCSNNFYRVNSDNYEEVPYTKDLGCRFKLSFQPDPNCPIPLWEKVVANTDNPVLFQQLCGLVISGYLHTMQKVFTMQGAGGAGKGTTCDVLTAMLPKEQVTSVPIDKMNEEKSLLELVDSRINIVSEVSQTKKIDLTGLKKIVGGDQINAWVLYQGTKPFTPNCSVVLSMNNWPKIAQVGQDVKRRFAHSIVRFTKRHGEQIDSLSQNMIEHELPGILQWCLEGLSLYFEHGLEDELSLTLYNDWISSMDVLELFYSECCVFVKGKKTPRSEIWPRFQKFCEDSGYTCMSKGDLFVKLSEARDRFTVTKSSGIYTLHGLALK